MKDKKLYQLLFFVPFVILALLVMGYLGYVKFDAFSVYGQAGITIIIDESPPGIYVYYPLNDTYNYVQDIYLHYLTTDPSPISSVWYNLNGGANTTLTGNTTINAVEGANSITVYANDSLGFLNSTTIAFFVNTSNPDEVVIPAVFSQPGSETTNLSQLSRPDQENITNFTLHNVEHSKIIFSELVNLSDDGKPPDGMNERKLINLSAYVNISFNRVYIDTTNLPNLNKSATLSLYNLTFTEPYVLMNNRTCPASVCSGLSYSGGSLVFDVAHFTEFRAAEGYVASETPPPSGSGGGGGTVGGVIRAPIGRKEFEVFESVIHFRAKGLQSVKGFLTINNPNTFALNLSFFINPLIDVLDIEGRMEKYSAEILPGETKKVALKFSPRKDTLAGVYVSKLTVTDGNTTKEVPILIDYSVGQPQVLDIRIVMLEDYGAVEDKVCTEIEVFNMGEKEKVDLEMKYSLKDLEGMPIASKSETFAIRTHLSKMVCLQLPDLLQEGSYIFSAEAKHAAGTAVSSERFEVISSEEERWKPSLFNLGISFLVIVLIILTIYLAVAVRKVLRKTRKRKRKK